MIIKSSLSRRVATRHRLVSLDYVVDILLYGSDGAANARRLRRATSRLFTINSRSLYSNAEPTKDDAVSEAGSDAEAGRSETIRPSSITSGGDKGSTSSSSSFLLAQAKLEEQIESDMLSKQKKDQDLVKASQEQAWDGDEPQARMIRRILEDSYKPLRVKGHVKQSQQPTMSSSQIDAATVTHSTTVTSTATTPLEPWQHTYKAPEHWQDPLIPHLAATKTSTKSKFGSHKAKGTVKSTLARQERLASAWERTLDYNAGIRNGNAAATRTTTMNGGADDLENDGPRRDRSQESLGQMHAWGGFVEDKIQKAQKQGLFRNIKGRGKPLLRDLEAESNPFIPRDDFLINRIVQRQGVAPPWIELQQQLEQNLQSFRVSVRQSWFRRATRILSLEGNSSRFGIEKIQSGWRDLEWERNERLFHETAINDLNQLTRKYNIQAPFHVRRGLLSLDDELIKILDKTRPAIVWELERRLQGGKVERFKSVKIGDRIIEGDDVEDGQAMQGSERKAVKDRMWPAFRRAVWEMLGIGQSAQQQQKQVAASEHRQ
ncbi:hypothetical protein ACM66B_006245 [Microbotryomycetes sp. NB124-2]